MPRIKKTTDTNLKVIERLRLIGWKCGGYCFWDDLLC